MSGESRPANFDFGAVPLHGSAGVRLLAWRPSPRLAAVAALLAAISLSPRIPLPLPIPGRAFELRVEDLVLVAVLPFWLARRSRFEVGLGRVPWIFAAYLAATLLSTVFGVVVIGLDPLRAFAYWGKAVELLLIALIVASWTRDRAERLAAAYWLLALGLANAVWIAVQLLTHWRTALFVVPYSAGAYVRPRQLESYGPGLIGEISPLSTGAFLMVLFLLAFGLFLVARRRAAWLGLLGAAAVFLGFTVVAQSRVSIAGAVVGAAILTAALGHRRRALAGFAVCAVAAIAMGVADNTASTGRLTVWHNIQHSLTFRIQHTYEPFLTWLAPKPAATPSPSGAASAPPVGTVTSPQPTPAAVSPTPGATGRPSAVVPTPRLAGTPRDPDFSGRSFVIAAIGRGSGAMGTPGLLPSEAHNHFLRVFIESGAVGLATFAALLGSLLWWLVRALRRRDLVGPDRVLVAAALAALIGFLLGALLQDMFLPVVPNELLWALVGLAAAGAMGATRAPAAEPR